MSERDPLILQTNVREVQHTEVAIRGIGTSVVLRKDVYTHSNHLIIQSRPYFRGNLPTYLYCPFFLKFAGLLFFASFLGALALEGGYYKGSPFYCFVVCAFFIAVFSQHEIVNMRSIPVVLMQPVFDGQIPLNALYEVTVTQLQGLALENYRAGIGFANVSEGKVKFQALSREAVRSLNRSRRTSRFMLFMFFCSACYNFYFMMVHSLGLQFSWCRLDVNDQHFPRQTIHPPEPFTWCVSIKVVG